MEIVIYTFNILFKCENEYLSAKNALDFVKRNS